MPNSESAHQILECFDEQQVFRETTDEFQERCFEYVKDAKPNLMMILNLASKVMYCAAAMSYQLSAKSTKNWLFFCEFGAVVGLQLWLWPG